MRFSFMTFSPGAIVPGEKAEGRFDFFDHQYFTVAIVQKKGVHTQIGQ
jgi:hypothetical protein